MRLWWWIVGILVALLLHVAAILFGGWFFLDDKPKHSTQAVELLGDLDAEKEKDKEKEPEDRPREELEKSEEKPPDAAEVMKNLDAPATDAAPALEAASLSQIEAALNGQGGGGGDFAQGMSFESGGRIGGTGKRGDGGDAFEDAFSLSEIDQKPRAVFQASPTYPAEMRGKKVEGVVSVVFVVDATGKVENPKVEKSSHAAFESPALKAIRKWKFEPAVRGGQRVASKMRVSIRFPVS